MRYMKKFQKFQMTKKKKTILEAKSIFMDLT